VILAKHADGGQDEAVPIEGGGFADYAVVSLHCLEFTLPNPIVKRLIC
jgi:hypothetical protein